MMPTGRLRLKSHIINYLLTELARAVLGNIGPRSFLYGPSAARSVLPRPWANIPQYGPRARLVRGYYSPKSEVNIGEYLPRRSRGNYSPIFTEPDKTAG